MRKKTKNRLVLIVWLSTCSSVLLIGWWWPVRLDEPRTDAGAVQLPISQPASEPAEAQDFDFSCYSRWRLQRPLFDPPPAPEAPQEPPPQLPPPNLKLYSIAVADGAPYRATFTDPTGAYLNRRIGESISDQRTTSVVEEIAIDHVLLRHENRVIRLSFNGATP